jgi:hypothetical protein
MVQKKRIVKETNQMKKYLKAIEHYVKINNLKGFDISPFFRTSNPYLEKYCKCYVMRNGGDYYIYKRLFKPPHNSSTTTFISFDQILTEYNRKQLLKELL